MSATPQTISISATKPSYLGSLPAEIFAQILKELLTLSKNEGYTETRAATRKWMQRCSFLPHIQPQVLRLSKSIHSFASDILDHSNRWVIFDMDCAHLLIPRIAESMGIIIVNPESAQALPSGMMHVRVKLYTHASVSANALDSRWPAALPKRQILLTPAGNVGNFLNELRKCELAYGVRVMPGKTFREFRAQQEKTAVIGVHGLSVRIHVNPKYPANIISTTLDEFRILHGPLNEVSIVGAPDKQQGRSIEMSITAPRNAAQESTFSEALTYATQLLHLADLRSKIQPVSWLYEQARETILNHRQLDRTPWAGRVTDAKLHASLFELLIMSACNTNWMVHNIITGGHWRFETTDEALFMHLPQSTEWLVTQWGLEGKLQAYQMLFGGLHCIFSCRIGRQRVPDKAAIARAIDLIEVTQNYLGRMRRKDALLFRVAYKMARQLSSPEISGNTFAVAKVIEKYKKWFSQNLKPIKWRVHESFISQTLRNRGILDALWKMPSQPDEHLARYHIIDTFEVDEWTKGEYYLL